MDLVIDASSIINLSNAGALELVVALEDCILCVSPMVVIECNPTCAAELLKHQQDGNLRFIDADDVSAETFLSLLEEHDLGEGETECFALLDSEPYILCCDDGKARTIARELYGEERVVGSLRLLKWAVRQGRCTTDEAFTYYEKMVEKGGFLPIIEKEWFESDE